MTILQSFGLTDVEAKLYEMLLPLGDVPMVEVIRAAKRHPQVVYRLVDQLAAKGLVLTETRRHRRFVRAEDPQVFAHLQSEKCKKLKEALPELRALQQHPREALVRIERGREAVQGLRKRAFSTLPPGGMYYILSASGTQFYELMGDVFQNVERLRIKRKIHKRMLAFESQRIMLEKNETMRTYVEMRYLPEIFPVPTSTNIYGNVVAVQIWSQDPIVILIESEEVAQSYKDYFETLWKIAKP
ncbi:MAG: helix-turn-helix domain-containing protein [Candidatus Peribacteraceae bacterium]|nr:helix-turn-helix domain-containing protein [Candidatus Peribacteraceae bacterium]